MKQTEDGWVFVRADSSPWEPGAFSPAFARFVKNTKLPHILFHDLRHSFGTLALASGVDLHTVSRALGHESTAITSRIYLQAVETLQDEAAARIDALLGNAVAGALAKLPIPVDPDVTLRQAQGDIESVPQRCHAPSFQTKNARRLERFVVAPTGIESEYSGPGRSA